MLKKSSKRFVISTDAPTTRQFRVRVEGIDLAEYNANPVLLWMHQRPSENNGFKVLPLGNMIELSKEDGKLMGTPAFDPTDDFADQIYKKVENATLRACSAGLVPLEWAVDAAGDIWLERSKMKEISIVDIGADPTALAVQLYDEQEQVIALSAEYFQTQTYTLKPNQNAMKVLTLSADLLPLIGLAEGATVDQVSTKIKELVTLAETQKTTINTLTQDKSAKEAEVIQLNAKVTELETLAVTQKITALVDGAVEGRKITADQKPHFLKLAQADFDSAKALIDSMPSNPSLKTEVEKNQEGKAAEYEKLSWDDMDKSGKLVALKAEFPDIFNAKFKEKFGKDYPGSK